MALWQFPISRRKLLGWSSGLGLWLAGRPLWSQTAGFVDMAVAPGGAGLWTLDILGRVRSIGSVPVFADPPEPIKELFVALQSTPTGGGLYALTAGGTLRTFGDARPFDTRALRAVRAPTVDLAVTPSGKGRWALDLLGRVHAIGAAPVFSDPPEPVRELFVALQSTPTGAGLYALTASGNLRTFGDALNFGGMR